MNMTPDSPEEAARDFQGALRNLIDAQSGLHRRRKWSSTPPETQSAGARSFGHASVGVSASDYQAHIGHIRDAARHVGQAQLEECAGKVWGRFTAETHDLERAATYLSIGLDAARPFAMKDGSQPEAFVPKIGG